MLADETEDEHEGNSCSGVLFGLAFSLILFSIAALALLTLGNQKKPTLAPQQPSHSILER